MSDKKLIIRRHVLVPIAAAAVTGTLLPFEGDDAADSAPMMRAARQTLIQAREHLQSAAADTGGHRVRAIRLVEKALNEVEAGTRVDHRV